MQYNLEFGKKRYYGSMDCEILNLRILSGNKTET
jgi:hypothetical protein